MSSATDHAGAGPPVPQTGFLWARVWWRLFGLSLALALLSTIGALVFVGLVNLGTDLVWGDGPASADLFSGSLSFVGIMTVAGLLVGVIHRLLPAAREENVFAAIVSGRMDPRPVPGALLVALTTLVGGFSLGPEVPTGMLAAGTASAVADRQEWDDPTRRVTLASSVGAAYSGLFTSPFVATMLNLELAQPRHVVALAMQAIQATAALVGFAVFFFVGGFSSLLSSLSLSGYELELWHFAAAAGVAVIAIGLGLLTGLFASFFRRLAAPLRDRVVVRGVLAGLGLGILATAVPLTLFSGGSTLGVTTSQAAEIGVVVLVVSIVAKLAAMTAAQAFGFIGGPIFPLVFAGGVMGAVVNLLVPEIPVELAVTAGMAAVPASILPLPLTLGLLAIVIAGTSLELGAPVLAASLLSSIIVRGLRRAGDAG